MAPNQSALRWSGARARACSIRRAGSPSSRLPFSRASVSASERSRPAASSDRVRVAHGGRSEPARLPEQGVDPDREQRDRGPEGDSGAPAGPETRPSGCLAGRGRGVVAGEVSQERARDVGLRLLQIRLPARARVPVVGFDLREAGAVGGEGRGAPVKPLGRRAANEGPREKADAGRSERGGEDPEEDGQSLRSDSPPAPTSRASRLRSSSVSPSRVGERLRIRRNNQTRAAAARTNGPNQRSAVAASKGGR